MYDRSFQDFPYTGDIAQHATCIPHCGYAPEMGPGLSFYYADALPSGVCTEARSPCSMTVAITCCGERTRGPTGGPVHGMTCRCVNGQWKCEIVSMGAAACRCQPPGVDAS